jgi:uncharacterized protein (DUF1778 family)
MAKTVTVRIDDETYKLIKSAAAGDRRTISNFMEYATVAYLSEEAFVSNEEMNEIQKDKELIKRLEKGDREIKARKYKLVK